MSSESHEYRPDRQRHASSSSTPETPRKRRRASTVSLRYRSHKQLRRHDVESNYNDDYRLLFNEQVEAAASRFEIATDVRDNATQIGSSFWTPDEKAVFFAALERLGRDDLPGIAGAIGTKSEFEARAFLLTLQSAADDRGDTRLTLRDVPAAIELSGECSEHLERVADALAWYQERHEASLEQERYGEYWLITPQIADDIDDAINGEVRPRSVSTASELEPRRPRSGIALSCISCKTRKVKCDRGFPCGRCAQNDRECEYPESIADVGEAKDPPRASVRPRSASGIPASEHEQIGGGYVGSCIACKKGKRKCDRGTPCARCAATNTDCQYALVGGSGVAGACERCKKFKTKCDRNSPCANCARAATDCIYPESTNTGMSRPSSSRSNGPTPMKTDDDEKPLADQDQEPEWEPKILQSIPEAALLNAKTMLTLSRTFFMNRSSEFPSPWPHWSEYTSELAAEPSIYRTAFNDLRTLTVSVTTRLVHATLMQTESRLRSQRPRARHEVQPFVKKRDVRAALDVLGMKRNGNERWQGVARRCGLKVLSSTATSRSKRTTVVPWSEVERILRADVARDLDPDMDIDISVEPEEFKKRAARSGTPLPMQNLTLADSEDDSEDDSVLGEHVEDENDDSDLEKDNEEVIDHFTDEGAMRQRAQARDTTGRFVTPGPDTQMPGSPPLKFSTLHDFDREASRQEEQALWTMLGMDPPLRNPTTPSSPSPTADSEKFATRDPDWRDTIDYRAPWEMFDKLPSEAKFSANRRSPSPMPLVSEMDSPSPSEDSSDDSSTSGAKKLRRRRVGEVELRARGANAYAALQGGELGGEGSSSEDEEEEEGDLMDQDIPTQSIE